MDLKKLFSMQKVLSQHIVEEKKLIETTLFPNYVLGLLVELGETANEWRGFKHWSVDQEPRRDKMLVEFVDCLHFVLEQGLHFRYEEHAIYHVRVRKSDFDQDITKDFILMYQQLLIFYLHRHSGNYVVMFQSLVDLGQALGFTWEEIQQAYIEKNQINHYRQESGY